MTHYLQRSFFAYLILLFVTATATAQSLPLVTPIIAFDDAGQRGTFFEPGAGGSAGPFQVIAVPLAILTSGNAPMPISAPAELNILILIDENGTLVGGTARQDLLVVGNGDVLLEGEIATFTFDDSGPGGTTDSYAMTFSVTGGTMAGDFGDEVGVNLLSEASDFGGTFFKSFSGNAKGNLGSLQSAAACNLSLDKTCLVVSSASADLACSSKITAARFRYIGLGFDGENSVEIVGGSGATATYVLELTQNQTVLADQNGYSIDATLSGESDLGSRTSIFINGVEEELHTSCSAPFVAGQPAPLNDPKGDPSPNWLVEAFIDKDGNVVSLPNPEFSDSCEIPALGSTECDQRPTAIQYRYTGADCSASSNGQSSDKFDCHDFGSSSLPVNIRVFSNDDTYADVTGATAGTIINATNGGDEFSSESHIEITDAAGNLLQTIRMHTSCSQPLAIGDSFGGMDVVGFTNEEQGTVQSGAEVLYRYLVSNAGPGDASNVIVTDSGLTPSQVPGSPIALLAAGTSQQLEATAFVAAPTNGTATVTGMSAGQICEDTDDTPVTIATPPPCNIAATEFELKDDAFKWDLSNQGAEDATISSISISWPDEFGALKEIKLNGKIFDGRANPTSATIDSFDGDLEDRQIEAGKTETLEFKFDNKYKQAQPGDFVITVSFAEGCDVMFTAETIVNDFGDCDGKIDQLVMLWNGMVEPVNIRAYAGAPGSELLLESGDLFRGNRVTVGGLSAAGAPNDVFWEVFDSAGNKLGQSKFHRSCSDDEMDGPEDCGMPEGNGKGNDSGFINDWALDGLTDEDSSFACTDI